MRKLFYVLIVMLILANSLGLIYDICNLSVVKQDLNKDIKVVEYWSRFCDASYAKQHEIDIDWLDERIQWERGLREDDFRVIKNLQREIAILNNEMAVLNAVKPESVLPNLVDSIQDTIGSVVHIANLSRGWQGSGVAWSEDIIVTARHVVEGGTNFIITLNDGTQIKAAEAISSKKYDIGFVKLDASDPNYIVLKPAEFGSVKETVLGQQIYVIGSPYGKINFNFVSLGIVSGLNRDQEDIDPYTDKDYGWSVAFTTDSAGHPGNSGCPVFTLDGKVRGILVGGYSPVLIICMPSDIFMNELETIKMMFEQKKFYDEKPVSSYPGSYTSKGD